MEFWIHLDRNIRKPLFSDLLKYFSFHKYDQGEVILHKILNFFHTEKPYLNSSNSLPLWTFRWTLLEEISISQLNHITNFEDWTQMESEQAGRNEWKKKVFVGTLLTVGDPSFLPGSLQSCCRNCNGCKMYNQH